MSKKDKTEEIAENSTMESENDELAMYIIVNNDLGMGKGKLVSQGSHAACEVVVQLEQMCFQQTKISDQCMRYKKWSRNGKAKIVLKGTQTDIESLLENPETCHIIDAGRTQIAPNSLTAIAFYPNYKKRMESIIGNFKLL